MRLCDIKVEALKLMFVKYDNIDLQSVSLDQLALDENYGNYLVNMTGSINRCFSNLETKGVLPVKTHNLQHSDGNPSGPLLRFNLNDLIKDLFEIERIVYRGKNGEYISECEYRKEGDILVVDDIETGDYYTVLYKPALPRITPTTDNAMVLPIPDNIAAYIPYFIKGDLYRDDEPSEASEARNWYEAAMEEILGAKVNKVNRVQSVYSQTET